MRCGPPSTPWCDGVWRGAVHAAPGRPPVGRSTVHSAGGSGASAGGTVPDVGHTEEGNQEPWNPKGIRAGRWTVATGGPENDVASRMTRSLVSLVLS